MLVRSRWSLKRKMSLASLAGFALAGQSALAQVPSGVSSGSPGAPYSMGNFSGSMPPQVAQTPQIPNASNFSDLSGGAVPMAPSNLNGGASGQPYFPPAAPPTPMTAPPSPYTGGETPFGGYGSAFAPGSFGSGAGNTVAANDGYLDSAIIRSRVRVRYDAAYGLNTPDKAEFFYAKCGCFANPANFGAFAATAGAFNNRIAAQNGYDPKARGPQHLPVVTGRRIDKFSGDPRIDYQEVATYLEYAPLRNFSTFIELPARFLNPTLVRNNYGFSDLNAGFKYAFVAEPDRFYTFQFRGYAPTGASGKGLGTGHVSLEPALLIFQRLSDRLYFSGEFRDWIPIGGSNFSGNILRYGAGLTYNMVLTDHFRIAPVNEVVGWTILNGKELVPTTDPTSNFSAIRSVAGDTIVNEKIGVRFGIGNYSNAGGGSALNDRHSIYIGYGRALTGDHWYKDVFRAEYNFWF